MSYLFSTPKHIEPYALLHSTIRDSITQSRSLQLRKTIFPEGEALCFMRKVNKNKFVQPKLNETSRLAKLNVQVMHNDAERLVNSCDARF
jgi:hypothetical protein